MPLGNKTWRLGTRPRLPCSRLVLRENGERRGREVKKEGREEGGRWQFLYAERIPKKKPAEALVRIVNEL